MFHLFPGSRRLTSSAQTEFQGITFMVDKGSIIGLLFGAALPGAFFYQENITFAKKNMILDYFQMIFHQNGPNLLLTRGTTIRTGILTLIEFWWVP